MLYRKKFFERDKKENTYIEEKEDETLKFCNFISLFTDRRNI